MTDLLYMGELFLLKVLALKIILFEIPERGGPEIFDCRFSCSCSLLSCRCMFRCSRMSYRNIWKIS